MVCPVSFFARHRGVSEWHTQALSAHGVTALLVWAILIVQLATGTVAKGHKVMKVHKYLGRIQMLLSPPLMISGWCLLLWKAYVDFWLHGAYKHILVADSIYYVVPQMSLLQMLYFYDVTKLHMTSRLYRIVGAWEGYVRSFALVSSCASTALLGWRSWREQWRLGFELIILTFPMTMLEMRLSYNHGSRRKLPHAVDGLLYTLSNIPGTQIVLAHDCYWLRDHCLGWTEIFLLDSFVLLVAFMWFEETYRACKGDMFKETFVKESDARVHPACDRANPAHVNIGGQIKPLDPACIMDLGKQTLEALQYVPLTSQHNLWPAVKPGELATKFQTHPPENPTDFSVVLKKMETHVFPGVLSWQHPLFMAYYPCSASTPAILAELVVAAIGSVGLQWFSNPIATELEVVVMDWVAKLLNLGGIFQHSSGAGGGLILGNSGEGMLNAMLCAKIRKHREVKPSLAWEDAFYQDSSSFVAYASSEAHYSVFKACRLAGLRTRILEAELDPSGNLALKAGSLRKAMEEDKRNGLTPIALVLTYGSTNTSGKDDLASFKEFAKELWIHVDAAYAGAAWCLEKFKVDADPLAEVATSLGVSGAKWFLCGFDTAFFWTKNRRLLTDVFAASGSYMADASEEPSQYAPEFKDWAVPCGRRFRSLRVWAVLECFGTAHFKSYIQRSIDQADWLRDRIDEHPAYEQPVTTEFGLVCVRSVHGDETTKFLCQHLQSHGFGVLASVLRGTVSVRVALGSPGTEQVHIEALWQSMVKFAEEMP